MNRSLVALLLFLCVAAGATYWVRNRAPEESLVDGAQPAESKGGSAKGPAEMKGAASTSKKKEDEPGMQEPGEPRPGPAPKTDLARRLGWTDAEANGVAEWHRGVQTAQQQHLDVFADDPDHPLPAAKEFNANMEGHRRELIERVGLDKANQVLRELPVYQFDLGSGSWHRVDAEGRTLPFQSITKENVWKAFKRR